MIPKYFRELEDIVVYRLILFISMKYFCIINFQKSREKAFANQRKTSAQLLH